jgi:homoserine acetyltransferase
VIENSYYSPEVQDPYELFDLGYFVLEEGYTLPDCKLAYATFGELSPAKDNAILITTWYSGTHQIFADVYIGPEHALNPEKYFIVVINQIGKCVPPAPYPRSRNSRQHSSFCNRQRYRMVNERLQRVTMPQFYSQCWIRTPENTPSRQCGE